MAATIIELVPMLNIMPFGICDSPANPMVIAATAVALGALTPMPCIPVTAAPWGPGAPTVLITDFPALDNNCKCKCNWGGVVAVNSRATTTMVP